MIFKRNRTERGPHDIAGKVIVVTGAGRGIGLCTAEAVRGLGAQVAIGDVDDEVAEKAAADLGAAAHHVDVTDAASFEDFLDRVQATLGPIDVLVNNAGIMPVGSLLSYDLPTIKRNFEIDLLGVVIGTQLAARRMIERGSGHIVNIASVAGRLPVPGLTIYNAAKAGVLAFSEAADLEFAGSGVRVSTVSPTFTRTSLISGLQTNRLIRTIAPEDVAKGVVRTIAHPVVHATVPGSMAWVHGHSAIPGPVRRASMSLIGLDRMFLSYDSAQRRDYLARIAAPKATGPDRDRSDPS